MSHGFIDFLRLMSVMDESKTKVKNVPSTTENCNNNHNLKVNKLADITFFSGRGDIFSVLVIF